MERIFILKGGPGTGKTTTFLSVLRQHPYTGQILFRGRDIEMSC